jgi:hypothetical protein
MFNKDFYPTPTSVIERMMLGIDMNQTFLEPSAGKGNIVDYLKQYNAKEVLACEINNDLAKIVASKCKMIGNDFLQVQAHEISHVNCIVMNPPFSADEAHIQHAWNVAPGGCTIISLCNSNTVARYARTDAQERIKELITLHGRSEDFGECFSDAERRTYVEVSCIWLYKPKTGNDEFTDYFFSQEEDDSGNGQEGLMSYNYVRDIVNRYVSAIKLFDQIMPLANEINALTKPISEYGIRFGAHKTGTANYGDSQISHDTYKKELQKQAWQHIFDEMKMSKYMTKTVQETMNKFVETQVHVPFTMRNVYKMLEIIVGTHGNRMNQILVDAFDTICGYSWKDNCTGGDRWKTNSDYVVNRKFIIPYICEYEHYSFYNTHVCLRNYGYGGHAQGVEDIVKALCYIVGMHYDNCTPLRTFLERMKCEWGQWYEWGFFRIRGYKKGTMHFEFTDEKVWEMFNRRVAEIKGWALPGTSNSTKQDRKKSTGLAKI